MPVINGENRRNWALAIVAGGGVAMTAYASVGLWFVRESPMYSFYLATSALVNIGLIFTGVLGLLVKRTLSISKSAINISDQQNDQISRPEAVTEAIAGIDGNTNKPS
jgi:hypothetical protein